MRAAGVEPLAKLPSCPLPVGAIPIGRCLGAYGIKGAVRVKPISGNAENLLSAKCLYVSISSGVLPVRTLALTAASVRVHNDSVIVLFSEVADRDGAHTLKGATLSVEREALGPTGIDEFYWVDLVGCHVTTVSGDALGTVSSLLSTGAHDVLSIDSAPPEAPRTRLIPFVSAYVKSVSVADKAIVVEWDPMWD